MKNNNRTFLKEDQTVNEVQLKDLYDLSSKTEREIITLVQTAINFSDVAIKNKALALKAGANELVTMIGNQMMANDMPVDPNITAPVEQDPNQKVPTEPKQQIEQPAEGTVIESVNLKESRVAMVKQLKTLLEALEPELLLDEEPIEPEAGEIDLTKEPNEGDGTESNVIDLSDPFQEIFDAAETTEFQNFKEKVLQILSSTQYADDEVFAGLISQMEAAQDSIQYDTVMTALYDWADENNVEIFTI